MTSKTSGVYLDQKTIFFRNILILPHDPVPLGENVLARKNFDSFSQETPIVRNWTFGPGKTVTFGQKFGTYFEGKSPSFWREKS
jgi:hypothetical protein